MLASEVPCRPPPAQPEDEFVEAPRRGRCREQPLARPGPRLPRAVHGRARRDGRERRAAVDPARPRLLAGRPAVGDQRLHARVRRLPAARRPRRRPRSAASGCSSRAWSSSRSPRCSTGSRRSAGMLIAARGAAGPRRRARLPRRAVDHHDDVRRGRGAHEGARRLERDRGRRRRLRPAARRHPHRPAVVGVDLLRQRADRHRRGRCSRCATCPESRAPDRPDSVRPRRRGHRDRRPHRARLRDRQGAGVRLGLGAARSGCSPSRVALLAAFVVIERRSKAPLVRLGIFRIALAHGRERRDAARRRRPVLDLLLRLALRAGGPRLLAAEGRPRVPAGDRRDHRRRGLAQQLVKRIGVRAVAVDRHADRRGRPVRCSRGVPVDGTYLGRPAARA